MTAMTSFSLPGRGGRLPTISFYETARARKQARRPSRVNARREEHLPMYRLWASIISQAILDVRERVPAEKIGAPVARANETRKAFHCRREKYLSAIKRGADAMRWLEGRDQGGLTFHDLCTALNLAPDAILSRLKKELQ